MIAFKTFAQCPPFARPVNIPLQYPWCEQTCTEEEIALLTQQGYTIMDESEYANYVIAAQVEYEANLAVPPIELNLATSDTFTTSVRYPKFALIGGNTEFQITPIAGTYTCTFNASVSYSAYPMFHKVAFYKNEEQVIDSLRSQDTSQANQSMTDTIQTIITCDGTDTISVRVSCDVSGSLTLNARTLTLTPLMEVDNG